ncbi:transcriptional regulator BetI [Glycomyces albus]
MPRTADHDLRRAQLAEAAFDLIAGAGLDAATMAAVAREAGFSVGLVQHYFGSKDELLLFTYRRTMDGVLERAYKLVSEGEAAHGTIAEILLDCLQQMWPLDARRRGEHRVAAAFHARSMDSPEVAEMARDTAAKIRGLVARSIENGKECGETEPGTASETAATGILALVDGLADQLYREAGRDLDGRPVAEAAVEILRGVLASTLPGECRQYR